MTNTKLIVTVCRGNIARSAFAEAMIARELKKRGLDHYVSISRGIQGTRVDPVPVKFPNITFYTDLYNDAKPSLEKYDVDLSSHVSKPIDERTAQEASILLAVDRKIQEALEELFPQETHKIHLLSELIGTSDEVRDPEGANGKETQESIFTQIYETVTSGFPRLLEILNDE